MESSVKSVKDVVIASMETKSSTNSPTYSSVVKQHPAILVAPVDPAQSCSDTRNAMRLKVNPVGLPINDVRNTAKGAIVIECKDRESSTQLMADVAAQLGPNYKVNVLSKRLPKLRVIGFSAEFSSTELRQKILDQNVDVAEGMDFKILSIFKIPRSSTFGAKIEVDPVSFTKIINNKKLHIGWDICFVFEAFDLVQCFKCFGFHHTSTSCLASLTCPRCSGVHKLVDCTANAECCTNCIQASTNLKITLDSAHSATNKNCPVYLRKISLEKRRINYSVD